MAERATLEQIFAPYKLEFVKTEWWSAYPIGQRLVNKYDVQGRVFMAGGEQLFKHFLW